MIITLLEDYENDKVDAVIISETNTKEDINCIITQVKANNPENWTIDDIIEALPNDCEVWTRWQDLGIAYY